MTDQIVRRRSIRAASHDYSSPGAYFVTICSHQKEHVFATVVRNEAMIGTLGRIVADCWQALPCHIPHVVLDEFAIMPNHIHGIVMIRDHDCIVGARHAVPHGEPRATVDRVGARHAVPLRHHVERFGNPVSGSLATVIRSFKSAAAKRINESRNTPGAPVWQRNYHEHIIRNEQELNSIREYIRNNPLNWAKRHGGTECCAPTNQPPSDRMTHD